MLGCRKSSMDRLNAKYISFTVFQFTKCRILAIIPAALINFFATLAI